MQVMFDNVRNGVWRVQLDNYQGRTSYQSIIKRGSHVLSDVSRYINPPVVVEDWKNICIVGRVGGGGHGGVAGEERVEAVHHGQQVGQLQGQMTL